MNLKKNYRKPFMYSNPVMFIVSLLLSTAICKAQFLDEFNKEKIEGWFTITGDGTPGMSFIPNNGYATIVIDGSKDKYNVYWTLIKRDITKWLDLTKLKDTIYQLCVEAKVRVHNAPRRLNFMVNTNRTTDFHIDLMEYDIPDTANWHIISMTTKKFDAKPGDTVYVQLAATDFGLEKYFADIDYYRADIVNVREAGPDKGNPVPYHPPIPDVKTFPNHIDAAHDCVVNPDFPEVNFNDFHIKEKEGDAFVLTINADLWGILRWDFSDFKNAKIDEAGLLELTTHSTSLGGNYVEVFGGDFGIEFNKVRVIEILGGDPQWNQNSVTYNTLTGGKKYPEVFNTQMVYDLDVNKEPGGKNYITISQPVLQRLINGATKGLLLRPLGAIDASFYSLENQQKNKNAKLHFTILNDK